MHVTIFTTCISTHSLVLNGVYSSHSPHFQQNEWTTRKKAFSFPFSVPPYTNKSFPPYLSNTSIPIRIIIFFSPWSVCTLYSLQVHSTNHFSEAREQMKTRTNKGWTIITSTKSDYGPKVCSANCYYM